MRIKHLSGAVFCGIVAAGSVQAAPLVTGIGIQGGPTVVTNWNTLSPSPWTNDIANLVDLSGNPSGVGLVTDDVNRFNLGSNANGTNAPTGAMATWFPSAVTVNSFFGQTGAFGGDVERLQANWTLTGLDPALSYDLIITASRTNSPPLTDVRTTLYTATGASVVRGTLDAANNTSNVLIMTVQPSAGGQIGLQFEANTNVAYGPVNTNGSKFFYIGGLRIENAIPEPASLSLLGFGVTAMGLRRRKASAE